MAKFKIKVIKLLMKNNKMADYGSIHNDNEFTRPVSDLEKEGFIEKASKADLDALAKVKKEEADTKKEEETKGKEE